MRDFSEYRRSHNDIKYRSGVKIFNKQLQGSEGVGVQIDGVSQKVLIHNNINPTNSKEYRAMHLPKSFNSAKRGSYVIYANENYLVTTDLDDHHVYWSCKLQKCNQTLKWKQYGTTYEYPCIIENDSYGVKIVSDNDYIRNSNIKAKLTIQANKHTDMLVPNVRFIFNHSEYDIYEIVDINKTIYPGLIVCICEKVSYQREDDLENNLAYSPVLQSGNVNNNKPPTDNPERPPIPPEDNIPLAIIGADAFLHSTTETYKLNKETPIYRFYIDDFDKDNIASIESQENNTCTIKAKYSRSNTWFTLYVFDENNKKVLEKQITIKAR